MALRRWMLVALPAALAGLAQLAAAPTADAAPCGTVGTPLACTIDVGGTIRYTVSDIAFVTSSAAGGGNLYDGEDVSIDIASGGGLSLLLSFGKVADGQGIVFLANAGESAGLTFSYTLTATALLPGSIDFDSITTSIAPFSTVANGVASVQGIVSGQVNCQAIVAADPSNTCAITGAGPLDVGDILSLSGGSGNVSLGGFSNLFLASFTPDDSTPVPAPAGLGLLLVGALGCAASRARRA
jgi:hypothetical protein